MKRRNLAPDAIDHARKLRRDMTKPERMLWRALRSTMPHHHWRKQVPLGPYFADFLSHSEKLIIELDGGQHATTGAYDEARTRFIEAQGYRVLRFWNSDVIGNPDGVLQLIAQRLAESRGPQ